MESDMSHKDHKQINCPWAKGLCLNCDDAETCKFSGFGDDIQFCEEHSSNFDTARQDNAACGNSGAGMNFGVKHLIPGWDS